MSAQPRSKPFPISREVIVQVCEIVKEMCGNQFEARQYPMVENRLRGRMAKLELADGELYLEYLKSHLKTEGEFLLSLLTTHHTYFFREFAHFEYLLKNLDSLIAKARNRGDRTIRVWSSACSFGQEVYSLAMFFDFHLKQFAPDVTYEIFGSDVDPQSIKIARNGVYKYDELKAIPVIYLGQNWSRGTGDIRDYAKIRNELKKRCHFGVFNLVKTEAAIPPKDQFDIIFCRNVFIYFNQPQIITASKYLLDHMAEGGLFFVGISESLTYLPLQLGHAGPSVYHKKSQLSVVVGQPRVLAQPSTEGLLRVLCVDDSPSVLKLLGRILTPDEGFSIVAIAENGKEAIAKMNAEEIDLVTLDIHMPEMDGISYLRSQLNPDHPPVVMLSTVHRDNMDVALESLRLGAVDYIEKPALANLEDRADEIRAKLKMAHWNRKPVPASLDTAFRRKYKVEKPEAKACIAFVGIQDRLMLQNMLNPLEADSPPLFLVFEGIGEFGPLLQQEIEKRTARPVRLPSSGEAAPGTVFILDLEKDKLLIGKLLRNKTCSILLCGKPTKKASRLLPDGSGHQLVLQDLGDLNIMVYGDLLARANQVAPMTSFVSLSEEFFK